MLEFLVAAALVASIASIVLGILNLRRKVSVDLTPLDSSLREVDRYFERTERVVRDELSRSREESSAATRQVREEVSGALKLGSDALVGQLETFSDSVERRLESARETVERRLQSLNEDNGKQLTLLRIDAATAAQNSRDEIGTSLKSFADQFSKQVSTLVEGNEQRLTHMRETIESRLTLLQTDNGCKHDQMRAEATVSAQKARDEVVASLKLFNDNINETIDGLVNLQRTRSSELILQVTKLGETSEKRLDAVRMSVEEKLKTIQEDNAKSLEQMRLTVDEKLHGTLEKRLGESFKLVSERLELVHKGLGEMQSLATGVGDLKRVLTNVKARGTFGEVQLERMLEQILVNGQYEKNVATSENGERVEFAIKLPGRSDDGVPVWLPIDAKFPIEDYQRLVEARERSDAEAEKTAGRQLESRIKDCAKNIKHKYCNPPRTTDFGILFLPTEGLFAEVISRSGLAEGVQRDHHVVVAGPTTLWSILNSLEMGFQTLAIQERTSEVWSCLAAVRTEFSKYAEVLDKVQKKLREASKTIDEDVARRARAVERQLQNIEVRASGSDSSQKLIESLFEQEDDIFSLVADEGSVSGDST